MSYYRKFIKRGFTTHFTWYNLFSIPSINLILLTAIRVNNLFRQRFISDNEMKFNISFFGNLKYEIFIIIISIIKPSQLI